MNKHKLSLFLPFGLLFISPISHSQAELAARVTEAIGGVEVVRANGSREVLQRRDEIRVGDNIETASDGVLQLMFRDGSLLALRCDSKLNVNAYRLQSDNAYNVELILYAGNLRTVVGGMAAVNYRVQIAGTVVRAVESDFEVALAEDGRQHFGAYDGAILIEHASNESRLGLGADADFGRLEPGFPFEELIQMPASLGHSILILPTNPNTRKSTNCAN